MTLNEWEQSNIEVLTSREMGAWLGRRDSRLLQEIRQEISQVFANSSISNTDLSFGILAIIDKHIKEIEE